MGVKDVLFKILNVERLEAIFDLLNARFVLSDSVDS
jgi:hypothetical protein